MCVRRVRGSSQKWERGWIEGADLRGDNDHCSEAVDVLGEGADNADEGKCNGERDASQDQLGHPHAARGDMGRHCDSSRLLHHCDRRLLHHLGRSESE